MTFDVNGARRAGYSDAEIADHLAQSKGFDVAGARKSGYSDAEILSHLVGPEAAKQPSTMDKIGRQVGLTARYALEGGLGLPAMVGDALGFKSSQAVSKLGDQLGLPQPQGALEQGVARVTRGMAGAASGVGLGGIMSGAANPVASGVGQVLSAGPGSQVVSAGTGAGAGVLAHEMGAGPAGELAATLAGSLAPSAAQYGLSTTVRGLMRGGEQGRQVMADRTATVRAAGAEPSVGMATGRRAAQATESTLAKVPGSAGKMAEVGPRMSEGVGAKIADIADNLSPSHDPTLAGARIEKGIKSFVSGFKAKQTQLYDQLDNYIPQNARVDVSETRRVLDELSTPIQGAENTSKVLRDPFIASLAAGLKQDATGTGAIPYEALKRVRTMIGDKMTDGALVSDVPKGQLKRLYGAMTDDMARAAKAAGPDAEKALSRANQYTAAGLDRIETHLHRVINPSAEKTYKTLVNDPGDATKIGTVLKSLPPEDRNVVRATFIERMGKALPGRQDEAGDVFSMETFLTNWNKLDPRSKLTLFAGGDGSLRRNLDDIAKTAAMVRDQSKVFANPSGSGAAIASYSGAGAVAVSALSGHLGTAAALLTAMGAANRAAWLMTKPEFVSWLAKSTKVNAAALPSVVNSLAQFVRYQKDPSLRDAADEVLFNLRKATGTAVQGQIQQR